VEIAPIKLAGNLSYYYCSATSTMVLVSYDGIQPEGQGGKVRSLNPLQTA